MVDKKHSGKAGQLMLASGGSEHAQLFSVAKSWGNKKNFSLCANMSGFCSDSHICTPQMGSHCLTLVLVRRLNDSLLLVT